MTHRHPVHGRNENSVLFNLSDMDRQQDAAAAQPQEMSGLLALRIPSQRRTSRAAVPRPSPPLVALAGGGRRSKTGWLPWAAFGASALALVACATWYFASAPAAAEAPPADKPVATATQVGTTAGAALGELEPLNTTVERPRVTAVAPEVETVETVNVPETPVTPAPISATDVTPSSDPVEKIDETPVKRPVKRPARRPVKHPAKQLKKQPQKEPVAKSDRAKELLKQLKPKTEPGTTKPIVGPSTSLPERLSSPKVRAKIKSASKRMKACLKLGDASGFGGTVNVRVELLGRGAVKSARARAAGLTPAMQSCMVRALKAVKFGQFQGTSQVVNYPLRLK